MRAYDIILKKREGLELTKAEIDYMILGYVKGEIPDYQISALAMAIFFKGMTARETADLTMTMVDSGDKIDLSPINGIKVDKHSTGGVGDKTTLILAPLVAAAGAPVAKMSGRGLGHTGGTLDKFESIGGFSVELPREKFIENVNRVKAAVVGQSGNLTPADKKLYALRDVTATVDSIPLIASSVMSKKIAAGADAIVLDVKAGSGAFMKTIDDSFKLAKAMVDIGSNVGRNTVAMITDMDQPLGFAVGNALEVKEAIETLQGRGPKDLLELCLELGALMLKLSNIISDKEEAKKKLLGLIQDGSAINKFKEIIIAQGGNPDVVDNPSLLPKANIIEEVKAVKDGFVQEIQAEEIGNIATFLGAGRETKESKVDLSVGIIIKKKVGMPITKGEPIAVIHANNHEKIEIAKERLTKAFRIGLEKTEAKPLIYGLVTKDEIIRY